MTPAMMKNIGKYITTIACGGARVTAAGAGDHTAVTGVSIDRRGYESVALIIAYLTTLTAAKTLKFAVEYQEADDNGAGAPGAWGTATSLQAATTAETGAQTAAVDEIRFNVDLSGKKRWIRFNFTPDLSHTDTDIADCFAVAVLGGAVEVPTSPA